MIELTIFTVVYLYFVILDIKKNFQKRKKVFWMNTVLFSASYLIGVLISSGVTIPSPVEPIKNFIESIFGS